jgi:hypothetical protein
MRDPAPERRMTAFLHVRRATARAFLERAS